MPRGIPKNGINKGWFKKGVPNSTEFKKWLSEKFKGKKVSLETRKKISLSKKGKSNGRWGYKHTEESKRKISLSHRGEKAYNWKGGITPERKRLYFSETYKKWRKAVFERDGYLCTIGGEIHGNKLQADHIKPWSLYPELRFEVSNGRTLCVNCHQMSHTYGGKIKKLKIKLCQKKN